MNVCILVESTFTKIFGTCNLQDWHGPKMATDAETCALGFPGLYSGIAVPQVYKSGCEVPQTKLEDHMGFGTRTSPQDPAHEL